MTEELDEATLDRALSDEDRDQRRAAFLTLLRSEGWRTVLAPHVICRQGYDSPEHGDEFIPDEVTLEQAAEVIARDEEKIHRTLELLGAKFGDELLVLLAQHMGTDFVEHGLDHLRTAEGERGVMLQQILHEADPRWVRDPAARRAIKRKLRAGGEGRLQLVSWLIDAGYLEPFAAELRAVLPEHLEEWSALGRIGTRDDELVNRALAHLGASAEPLAYLLRLDELPAGTCQRMLSAARPEWVTAAVEVAIMEGLTRPELVPVAELAVRLGGRHLAAAVAWLNSARLGPRLLGQLAAQIEDHGRERLGNTLWVQHRAPSANRALEAGRADRDPEPRDASALVRQLQGGRMLELVQEILEEPRPTLMEPVLHHLCAVNQEAAARVQKLEHSPNPELARRAREAREWPDVLWPEQDEEDDLPNTFGPLGRGI